MPIYLAIFGCAVLILIEVWVSVRMLLDGQRMLAVQANKNYADLVKVLDVQPPLADETPQPVKVTLIARPTNEDWNRFYDYEATQRNALKELEDQK